MTLSGPFPLLQLSSWRPTRDTLHAYCRVLGRIRRSLTPKQKHWWHTSLRVQEYGLSTSTISVPGRENDTFEIWLDLDNHKVRFQRNQEEERRLDLEGKSSREFMESALSVLAQWNISPDIDRSLFEDSNPRVYVPSDAQEFWEVIYRLHKVLEEFKSELPAETSPIHFWPHNFDLALMWLSGRKIPGMDPENEEKSDEQMAFGFSTGDVGTPDAYLYVTEYPWPTEIVEKELPEGAVWHTEGWKGALLSFASVARSEDPDARTLEFFRAVYRFGSAYLR